MALIACMLALCAAALFAPGVQDAQAIALWENSSGTLLWGNWFGWGCCDKNGNATSDWSDEYMDGGEAMTCWNCGHKQYFDSSYLQGKALSSKCTATECYRYASCQACGERAFLVRYEHNTSQSGSSCSVCGRSHTCAEESDWAQAKVRTCITAQYCPTCYKVYKFSVTHRGGTYYKYTYKNASTHTKYTMCSTCKTAWGYDGVEESHTISDGACTLCQTEHEHSYKWVVTKEATCQTSGTKVYTCSSCGDVNGSLTYTGDHSYKYSAWNNGQRSVTCAYCSYSNTETCSHEDETGDYCGVCGKELRVLSVTVPTTLPVTVNANGKAKCATAARIVNNSTAVVKVSGASIEALGSWKLASYGDDFTKKKVNAKRFGFKLTSIGSVGQGKTSGSDDAQSLLSEEVTIAKGASAKLAYAAKATATSKALSNEQVAQVTFTVGWAK